MEARTTQNMKKLQENPIYSHIAEKDEDEPKLEEFESSKDSQGEDRIKTPKEHHEKEVAKLPKTNQRQRKKEKFEGVDPNSYLKSIYEPTIPFSQAL